MIQPSLLSAPASKVTRETLNARLAAYFKARPNVWIDAHELLAIAGFGGWRTRISNLRFRPWSMQIDNKVRTTVLADGARITLSYYKYVPTED